MIEFFSFSAAFIEIQNMSMYIYICIPRLLAQKGTRIDGDGKKKTSIEITNSGSCDWSNRKDRLKQPASETKRKKESWGWRKLGERRREGGGKGSESHISLEYFI